MEVSSPARMRLTASRLTGLQLVLTSKLYKDPDKIQTRPGGRSVPACPKRGYKLPKHHSIAKLNYAKAETWLLALMHAST